MKVNKGYFRVLSRRVNMKTPDQGLENRGNDQFSGLVTKFYTN